MKTILHSASLPLRDTKAIAASFIIAFLAIVAMPSAANAQEDEGEYYGVKVCNIKVTSKNKNNIKGAGIWYTNSECSKDYWVRYFPEENALVFHNVKINWLNKETPAVINESNKGLSIIFDGESSIKSAWTPAVQCNVDTKFDQGEFREYSVYLKGGRHWSPDDFSIGGKGCAIRIENGATVSILWGTFQLSQEAKPLESAGKKRDIVSAIIEGATGKEKLIIEKANINFNRGRFLSNDTILPIMAIYNVEEMTVTESRLNMKKDLKMERCKGVKKITHTGGRELKNWLPYMLDVTYLDCHDNGLRPGDIQPLTGGKIFNGGTLICYGNELYNKDDKTKIDLTDLISELNDTKIYFRRKSFDDKNLLNKSQYDLTTNVCNNEVLYDDGTKCGYAAPMAIFDEEKGVLKFFAGDYMLADNNTSFAGFENVSASQRPWQALAAVIDSVSIDRSFADFKPTSLNGWFMNMKNLRRIGGIRYLNTEDVLAMSEMFSGCESLEKVSLSNFNVENVDDFSSMFAGCKKLETLSLRNFEKAVPSVITAMFSGCESMKKIDAKRLNTANVENMAGLFKDCKGIEKIDISGFKFDNIDNADDMFSGTNLKEVNIGSLNLKSLPDFMSAFFDGVGTIESPCRLRMNSQFDLTYLTDKYNKEHNVFEVLGGVFDVGNAKVPLIDQKGAVTAIEGVRVDTQDNAPAYNINGQRVSAGYKGVVIKGGKKYVIK